MKRYNKKKWIYGFGTILVVVCLLTLFLLLTPVAVLQISEPLQNEKLLYQIWIKPEDTFSIHWTHSVTKQPVIETYYVQEELTIGIKEMFFNEHGPNLPAGPESGTKWEIKDGMFRVYNYDVSFEKLPVRIGQVVADHTFYYSHHEVPLRELASPGGFVEIEATKISLLKYLIRREAH